MTSLAAQLKKLSVPDTKITLGGDFKQASFLYNEREAAKYDKQHFYNIGINGLQQLMAKDERFAEFENTIFSSSAQSLQRNVQTKESNELLDAILVKCLLRLSPYMQLRESHKAMEWLVHRFSVHLRNVDAFMMCVLPYHDQEPFIMALRLLKMNTAECAKWRWLDSVKKADTFLARAVLITHCRTARGFLGLLGEMVAKHIEANMDDEGIPLRKHVARVISFYTQTVLGVLLACPPSEDIVSTLIPFLSTGLKATKLPDLVISSYMIFSQLLVSTSLAEPLLVSMLNVVCKNASEPFLKTALQVVVIMFQRQSISRFPKKALRHLTCRPSLCSELSKLSLESRLEPFLMPFLSALTQKVLKDGGTAATSDSNADDEELSPLSPLALLKDVMESVEIGRKSVTVVTRHLLDWFAEMAMDQDGISATQQEIFKIFRFLENRYFHLLQQATSTWCASREFGEDIVERLQLKTVELAHQDLMTDPTTAVTVCLMHHQKTVRKSAVERILQDPTLIQDKGNFQTALSLRLKDEDAEVVDAVLENPQNLLELFEDQQLLYDSLMDKLIALGVSSTKSKTRDQLILTVCCMPSNQRLNEMERTVVVLSFLVALNEEEVDLVQDLLLSPFAVSNETLCHLKTTLLPEIMQMKKKGGKMDVAALACSLANQIAQFLSTKDSVKELSSWYSFIDRTPRPGSTALLITMVHITLMDMVKSEDLTLALQKQLVSIITDLTVNKKAEDVVSSSWNEDLSTSQSAMCACIWSLDQEGMLPLELASYCLQKLKLEKMPQTFLDSSFWEFSRVSEVDADWLSCVTCVFTLLLELSAANCSSKNRLAQRVFPGFFKAFPGHGSVLKLLCWVWTCPPHQGVTPVTRGQSLQFGQALFSSLSHQDKCTLVTADATTVLSCLLVLMTNECEQARKVSFNILGTLSEPSAQLTSPFSWFASRLLRYRQEVEKDQAFLAQVLKNSFEDESDLSPPSPKKKRTSGSTYSTSQALTFLLDVIGSPHTPSTIQLGLLVALSRLDTVESFVPLTKFMKEIVTKRTSALTLIEADMLKLLLKRFSPTVAPSIDKKSVSLEALQAVLRCEVLDPVTGDTVQLLSAKQLHKPFMAAVPDETRLAILGQLLEIITASKNVRVTKRCRKVLKQMKLDPKLISDQVSAVLGHSTAETVRDAKRQKVHSVKTSQDSEFVSLPWKKVIALLELMHNKKHVRHLSAFVPVAFQLLARVLEMEAAGSGEFLKQLILGAVYNICSKCTDGTGEQVTGEQLNVQLIVQCIRQSDDAQTHHQALLLLSIAAKIAPDILLHNMMTVFTFMGASMLRQDNEYSFQVIARLLENVVPALITACEEKAKQASPSRKKTGSKLDGAPQFSPSDSVITVVLRVFVDALPHMPSHRKISLFSKLLSVVGVESYMWRLVLVLIGSLVSRPRAAVQEDALVLDKEKASGPLASTDMEFLVSLSEEFSSFQLFGCMAQIVDYLSHLPEDVGHTARKKEKPQPTSLDCMTMEDVELFSVQYHTPKQLRHFKFASVYVLTQLLASQNLVAQLCATETSVFLQHFRRLMETVLHYINQVTDANERHRQDDSTKFWRLFLHKCHDLLDSLVKLLPDAMFMEVVYDLMGHTLKAVQKHSIDLLNAKLQHYKESSLTKDQASMLLKMTAKLRTVVSENLLETSASAVTDDELISGQTAIYSLKILCRILGKGNHHEFLQVLKLCVKALSQHNDNSVVCASAMLCIAEVVHSAKAHAVGHLGDFVHLVVGHIQSQTILNHEVLLLASVSSLQKIIEAVPLFLSPYLVDIIVEICAVKSLIESKPSSHRPVVLQKVNSICTTISSLTATRTFLPSLEMSFFILQDKNVLCIDCALVMLKEHIVKMSRDDLTAFSQDLLKFFCTCFELRISKPEADDSDLDTAEGSVIEAFVSLVFKLSEAQFKPMLLQLYNWATDESASRGRILVFYRLCDSLAERLKNLFTLFAGHILKHASETMDRNNRCRGKVDYFGKGREARATSCRLLKYILGCLQKTFMHDTEGFLNQERFDTVMQPLVDQIENDLGKSSEAQSRIEEFVVPCLARLAVAAHDDVMWKSLNYQMLLKTRHESAKVRLWALSAVDALHRNLGEDYIQLVPETIPFMAELMEDESDEVEKYTQKVIAAMEISVGENLQEYF